MITQRRYIQAPNGQIRDAEWAVDLSVLAATQRWAADRARAESELSAMQQLYPAWVLTAGNGELPLERGDRKDVAVPMAGAWRWLSDGSKVSNARQQCALMWEGWLPAPLAGLPQTAQRLRRCSASEDIAGAEWTSVPVSVAYPSDFPNTEPSVFYRSEWLKVIGVSASTQVHILGGSRLCLFYPGHWKRRYTVADVLSQRVINHVYSILKVAEGAAPHEAFIGRVHDQQWRPGA
ncbi:MAG TPA: hypothetical protein VEK08_23185 [Planctomycetota bacterium]|nr:hypothetical protein [Planctomycetota bacterium]